MTELPLYIIDSFSSIPFSGNPAAVCLDVTYDVGCYDHPCVKTLYYRPPSVLAWGYTE